MDVRVLVDDENECGEGPLYHPDEMAVYWVDIPRGHLARFDLATGERTLVYKGEALGGATLQDDGSLLLFGARGKILRYADEGVEVLLDEIPAERESRFNDLIADPEGRVFAGTMPSPAGPGRLYRIDPDGFLTIVLEGVGCSNGLGFSPDLQTLYFIDSPTRRVDAFDYDRATGEIGNRRPLVHTPDDGSVPDGMTVDAEGNLWVAFWDGGRLTQYAPDGTEIRRVEVPAVRKVTSLIFGGPNEATAFVTSAGGGAKDRDGANAGAFFAMDLGIRGRPEFRSRIRSVELR